jgi:hypothetical protein
VDECLAFGVIEGMVAQGARQEMHSRSLLNLPAQHVGPKASEFNQPESGLALYNSGERSDASQISVFYLSQMPDQRAMYFRRVSTHSRQNRTVEEVPH